MKASRAVARQMQALERAAETAQTNADALARAEAKVDALIKRVNALAAQIDTLAKAGAEKEGGEK
jgi:prefoldin subunit 5